MSKEILFAARISSIERFTGEKAENFVNRYHHILGRFLDVNKVNGILSGNSIYQKEYIMLNRAKRLAESETDEMGKNTKRGRNLSSVFSRISVTDRQKDRKLFYRYNLEIMSPENAFPSDNVVTHKLDNLLQAFYDEMDILANSENELKDFETFCVCFDRISQKYMWCITASDYEGEDISLYDNMKVSEAIMVCLLLSDCEETPYTMVSGDFSGIQKYIFSVASANQKNVAKRLRARSFYVDIISKIFSRYVIDCLKVGQSNILLQTGGKFYCIVPTTKDIEQQLNDIRKEFDCYLYKTFGGNVSVNLAWITFGDNGLERYSDTVVALNELLGERKTTPFAEILKTPAGWNKEAFILNDDLKDKHLCGVCGVELVKASEDCCPMCKQQIEIGAKLPKTKYIVYTRGQRSDVYMMFKDYGIMLASDANQKIFKEAYLIEALNESLIAGSQAALPFTRKYMANHIPIEENEPQSFSDIAKKSSGMNKLGVLKADVDILGFLFAQGLRTKERHFGTISRVNTMSRMLEVFFCGYIESMLENIKDYRNVYSVFSGGDDLFLLGPWDVMIQLSVEIQKKFKEFVAYNEHITMSAAVSVFDEKEHIAHMADFSESCLERAKNEMLLEVYPNSKGRNAVCVMNQLFSWEDLELQMDNAKRLVEIVKHRKVDIGILRRVIKYSSMYRQFLIDRDVWKLIFEPMFFYDRKRNYRFRKNDDEMNWFTNEYIMSMENASDIQNVRKSLFFAETIITIALNMTRGERG